MGTGYRGTFVISWSQTEVDGLQAAPRDSLVVGAGWTWHGEAVQVDGPSDVLRLEQAGEDAAEVGALVRITCKFSYICNTCNFTCITCKEFWLTCKNRDSRQISSFSKKFGEIPTKFHQNLASKWQNSIKKC